MNIAVDFGNTRIKAALFNDRQLAELKVYDSAEQLFKDVAFFQKAQNCILGSVTKDHELFNSILPAGCRLFEFVASTPTPLKNKYKSASTLGSDRLAASVGAYSLYPFKDILVIDAGTCLKFNFTNKNNEYIGGAISPGLQMRLKALHHFTAKLPLVKFDEQFNKLVGETTQESILSGVLNGMAGEIDSVISEYKIAYPELLVIITGGDGSYFVKHLKSRIFAQPELVLTGLNEILIYNS